MYVICRENLLTTYFLDLARRRIGVECEQLRRRRVHSRAVRERLASGHHYGTGTVRVCACPHPSHSGCAGWKCITTYQPTMCTCAFVTMVNSHWKCRSLLQSTAICSCTISRSTRKTARGQTLPPTTGSARTIANLVQAHFWRAFKMLPDFDTKQNSLTRLGQLLFLLLTRTGEQVLFCVKIRQHFGRAPGVSLYMFCNGSSGPSIRHRNCT